MVKILLVQENKDNYIELINNINSLNDKSKLYKSVNNKQDAINIISHNSIDILIIEYDIFKTFNMLEFTDIDKIVNYIIILNEKAENFSNNYKEKLIFINKKILINTLEDVIHLCNSKNEYSEEILIKNKIRHELKNIGYNMGYIGSKLLVECIYCFYKDYDSFDEKYIKDTYPIAGKIYHKSANTVKGAIRRATSMMFFDTDENKLIEYFGTCTLPKTGVKIVVESVLNKLYNN